MSNVAQNEASAEPERPAEGMSDAQLAEVAALRARVADLETARDRAEAKATAYKAERDLAVDWSARKQDAPSGLRVTALLAAVDNAVSNTRTATDDYLTGTRDAYVTAARLIRAHLGEPTPTERAAAEVLTIEIGPIIGSDVLPGEYEAAGAAVAMMRDPKVVAVVTEVLALAPALADISGGPGTVDEAWQDIGREMQEPCGRNGLLTIAMLAIHGALAYDAAGLPTAGSSIARRVAEGELRGEEFHEQADALAPGDGGKAGGVPCPVHANGADGLNCDVCIRASTERAAKGGA